MNYVSDEYCQFCKCMSSEGSRCLNGDAHRRITWEGECYSSGRITPDSVRLAKAPKK